MVQKKRTTSLVPVVAIFVGLALVFAIFVALARFVFMDNGFAQTTLIAVGSALLGAGLTFFLIELFTLQGEVRSPTSKPEPEQERLPVTK